MEEDADAVPVAEERGRGALRGFGSLAVLMLFGVSLEGCGGGGGDDGSTAEILVFAAASLQDALSELEIPFEQASGVRLSFNFAGSNVLAQQIRASQAADVFVSADEEWMDWLEQDGRLVAESRRTLLSNRLVLIAHPRASLSVERLEDLAAVEFSFLSVGDPEAVPAGRYARSALVATAVGESNLWEVLSSRVVPAPDVRAALALVEAEERALGIVYRSDVAAGSKVRVLMELEVDLAAPILYSAAVVEHSMGVTAAAGEYLDFLSASAAREVFARHGFVLLP